MATSQSNQHPNEAVVGNLPFHRLDAYRVALELVRLAAGVPAVRGSAEMRDQLRRRPVRWP